MSKHSNPEAKLGISPELRGKGKPRSQRVPEVNKAPLNMPPKGTNANNQYR